MVVIDFNNIPVLITGNHPVVNLVTKELSCFPTTSKTPKVKFNIIKDEIYPDEGSLNLSNEIYASDKSLYINLASFHYSIKIYRTKNLQNWNIDISCDTNIIPTNPLEKIVEFGYKVKNWTYLTKIEQTAYHIINGVFEPFLLFLTQDDRTFLHASSIMKGDDAMLITGWGGTGKTSTCMELIYEDDWKFLSDDISLIGADGTVLLYPRYMMIYAYNVEDNKKLYSKLMEGRSFIYRFQWIIKKRRNGLKGVRRRIPADVIFGKNKIGNKGCISKVLYLIRSNSKGFILKETTAQELAMRSANVIGAEYYYYLRYIRAWQSMGYSPTTVEKILKNNQEICNEAFKNAGCFIIFVPQKASPKELSNYIRENILSDF